MANTTTSPVTPIQFGNLHPPQWHDKPPVPGLYVIYYGWEPPAACTVKIPDPELFAQHRPGLKVFGPIPDQDPDRPLQIGW